MVTFTARLNELDKQHKFALLRSVYGCGNYRKEIHRLRLPEKLCHIYEDMGLADIGRRYLQEHNTLQHERMARRFLSCYSCGGPFLRSISSCELYCKNCGRVEVQEDNAPAYTDRNSHFIPVKQRQSARFYAFSNALKRVFKNLPVALTLDQINEIKGNFKLIETHLPRISYKFVLYKILEITTPHKCPQRAIVNCLRQQMSVKMLIKNEHLWDKALKDLN